MVKVRTIKGKAKKGDRVKLSSKLAKVYGFKFGIIHTDFNKRSDGRVLYYIKKRNAGTYPSEIYPATSSDFKKI